MLILVLLLIEICLFILGFVATGKDVFRPGVLMVAMFIISTSIAAVNIVNWKIDYFSDTVLILSAGLLCAVGAELLVSRKGTSTPITAAPRLFMIKRSFLVLVIAFELIALLLYYREIVRLATLNGYVEGANLLWHFRNITSYESEASVSTLVTFMIRTVDAIGYVFTFLLVSNIIAGRKRLAEVLPLCFPIILFATKDLMGSGRQELLRWAAFTLVSVYILVNCKYGWNRLLSGKFIGRILVIIPVVFVLFYLATNIIGRETSRSFFDYISTYAGGSIQHFNQFITDPGSAETETHFGAETFPGIYSFLHSLGLTDYTRPVHLEMRQLGITQGNVYTFFRRPLHDFGIGGMCVMTFIVVLAFSTWYSRIRYIQNRERREQSIILYSYLIYWIVLSSIEQYSIGIVSLGSVFTIIMIIIVYKMLTLFGLVAAAPPGEEDGAKQDIPRYGNKRIQPEIHVGLAVFK